MIILDWRGGFVWWDGEGVTATSVFLPAFDPVTVTAIAPDDLVGLRDKLMRDVNEPLVNDEILDYRAERLWRGEESDR